MFPNPTLLEGLQGELIRHLIAFLPELIVCFTIVLLLILGAASAVGLRIEALTWRDRPAERPLAQRWKAMGGGQERPPWPEAGTARPTARTVSSAL